LTCPRCRHAGFARRRTFVVASADARAFARDTGTQPVRFFGGSVAITALPCRTAEDGAVLNNKAAARLLDRLSFSRNGRMAEAHRVHVGEIEVRGHALKIADAAYGDELP
jgi:hypothetical protein